MPLRICRERTKASVRHGLLSETPTLRTCRRTIPAAMFVLIAWQLLAGFACAVEIRINEIRWGFNGKVALNRFNMLSVEVDNPSPQPFEGVFKLQKKYGDAEIVETITLNPFQKRWVQFYPYISGSGNSSFEEWYVTYGRGQKEDVPPPRFAKFQRVVLDDSKGLSRRGGVLKPMPEELFPGFVSATDALQVVGLDHEPRSWIPTQKEAFLDWLHLGGTAVLLQGPNGKFPEFSGPLAVLNSPLDDRNYGAGRVLKVAMPRSQFDTDQARRGFAGLPKNYLPPNEKPEDPIDVVDESIQNQTSTTNPYGEGSDPFVSSSFLSQLKEMTKPDHNWVLLHFMFWVYIAMVFPGCYLLGKRWSDFRVVYAGLLGTVVLFSFLFSIVGQRGYGEATAVHSVAIARSLPDGGLDVAGWSNVFVTGGAYYTIKHNGSGALYSACSEHERVNGAINNGTDGSFYVDIPPFSNREFAMRIKLPTGSPTITIDESKLAAGRLTDLSLNVAGINPTDAQSSFALFGDRFYSLHWNGSKLKLSADAGDAIGMLKLQEVYNWSNNRNYGYGYDRVKTPQERFLEMFSPLLSRSLNVAREAEARQVSLPAEVLRVFVYAKMPAEFAVQNKGLGAQEGKVLYCVDLPLVDE